MNKKALAKAPKEHDYISWISERAFKRGSELEKKKSKKLLKALRDIRKWGRKKVDGKWTMNIQGLRASEAIVEYIWDEE